MNEPTDTISQATHGKFLQPFEIKLKADDQHISLEFMIFFLINIFFNPFITQLSHDKKEIYIWLVGERNN